MTRDGATREQLTEQLQVHAEGLRARSSTSPASSGRDSTDGTTAQASNATEALVMHTKTRRPFAKHNSTQDMLFNDRLM